MSAPPRPVFDHAARLSLVVAFGAFGLAPALKGSLDFSGVLRFWDVAIALPAAVLGVVLWAREPRGAVLPWAAALVGWYALSLGWTRASEFNRGLLVAGHFAVVLPIATLLARTRHDRAGVIAFVATSLVSGFVLMVWSSEMLETGDRFGGLTDDDGTKRTNPNQLGSQMAWAALLSALLYFARAKAVAKGAWTTRPVFPVLGGLFAIVVLLTGSRGALVAMSVPLAYLFWHRKDGAVRTLGVAGAALFLFDFAFGYSPVDVVASRAQDDTTATLGDRLPIWEAGLRALVRDPLRLAIGQGAGAVDWFLGMYADHPKMGPDGVWRRNPHNAFLGLLVDTGIVGIAIGAGLLVELVRRARRLDAAEGAYGRVATLLFVLTASWTITVYREIYFTMYASLVLAWLGPVTARHADRSLPTSPSSLATSSAKDALTSARSASSVSLR